MKTPSAQKPKLRTPPYILGVIVFLLLTLLIILQSSNLWKTLSVETASDTLLLYALSSLNFVALVIFGFIFARNILKLVRERRALQLGSKIKTRLLIYFFGVSILPLIAMAVFSYLFLNRALERWFTQIPENVVRQARDLQDSAVTDKMQRLNESVKMLASIIGEPSEEKLRQLADGGNLAHIEVIGKDGSVLVSAGKADSSGADPGLAEVLLLVRQGNYAAPELSDGKKFDAAAAPLPDGNILVIVPAGLSVENLGQIVDESLEEYDRLKEKQKTVRQIGMTTLGLLTFLLVFASSWTALYIAKGLTRPIKALAEGANEIARGNLSHRVDAAAEDELALLVATFNEMSAKLEENSAELEERRRYIETILQSLSTGVISFDSDNRVTTINRAAAEIFELESGDFSGLKLSKLLNEDNRAALEKLLARAKRVGFAAEQTILSRENAEASSADRDHLPVALTATALPGGAGVVLVIEDLTELIVAQRAFAWQEVARRMAHEIKNPLTPIQLSAERIAKRFAAQSSDERMNGADSGEQLVKIIDESTSTILREVSSLKSMVDEFSRFARLPDVKLEQGNLNDVIRRTMALYEDRHHDVKFSARLEAKLPNVMVDGEQLKRVFVNLIDNSIEAFGSGQQDKEIELRTIYDKARDVIVAEVSDNGGGIPPAAFQKLFQPYFSTKGRGTGLGLAIVHRIVSEHRGKIRAVNNTDAGARFIVELPVVG